MKRKKNRTLKAPKTAPSLNTDPRLNAVLILNRMRIEDIPLDRALDDVSMIQDQMPMRDSRLFHALVLGTIRHRRYLDWLISHFSNRSLEKLDIEILSILRMGFFQMVEMDRIPGFAIVNSSVDLARALGKNYAAGFVNAVLRKAAQADAFSDLSDEMLDPAEKMALIHSYPEWMAKRWVKRYGEEGAEKLMKSMNTVPGLSLRVNSCICDRKTLINALEKEAEGVNPSIYSEEGVWITGAYPSIEKMQAFQEGLFHVQDEAAQLISRILDPRPKERILDACAGLGGKTGHIARIMKKGTLVFLDRHPEKLSRFLMEAERTGLSRLSHLNMEKVVHDLNEKPRGAEFGEFDGILLDAPCSGMGVIRRNPDTKWRVKERHLAENQDRQVRFLHNLADLVKPGGRMVYAVCSFEPEESEEVIDQFLQNHPVFHLEKKLNGLPDAAKPLVDENGFFKTLPHLHHTDGFFGALLVRKNQTI